MCPNAGLVLECATHAHRALRRDRLRARVWFVPLRQPAQRVGASTPLFAGFICGNGADAGHAWSRLIVTHNADAAILLGGLGDTIKGVVLIRRNAISRVSATEVRIADCRRVTGK